MLCHTFWQYDVVLRHDVFPDVFLDIMIYLLTSWCTNHSTLWRTFDVLFVQVRKAQLIQVYPFVKLSSKYITDMRLSSVYECNNIRLGWPYPKWGASHTCPYSVRLTLIPLRITSTLLRISVRELSEYRRNTTHQKYDKVYICHSRPSILGLLIKVFMYNLVRYHEIKFGYINDSLHRRKFLLSL